MINQAGQGCSLNCCSAGVCKGLCGTRILEGDKSETEPSERYLGQEQRQSLSPWWKEKTRGEGGRLNSSPQLGLKGVKLRHLEQARSPPCFRKAASAGGSPCPALGATGAESAASALTFPEVVLEEGEAARLRERPYSRLSIPRRRERSRAGTRNPPSRTGLPQPPRTKGAACPAASRGPGRPPPGPRCL